ncbi:MAG: nucleotide exchange factor GrpE [Rhabdochlamydiaceae bacterium]
MTEEDQNAKHEEVKECQDSCSSNDSSCSSLENELKEWKDKYFRLLAESENTRKRMIKEKQDYAKFSIESIIEEFLNPIDNLENALQHAHNGSAEVQNWALGFQMILNQFTEVLSQQGVAPFKSEGTLFNPHQHEAVESFETEEHPEGLVIKEFIKGYKCGERIIRPAKVKVAKTPSIPTIKEELEKN